MGRRCDHRTDCSNDAKPTKGRSAMLNPREPPPSAALPAPFVAQGARMMPVAPPKTGRGGGSRVRKGCGREETRPRNRSIGWLHRGCRAAAGLTEAARQASTAKVKVRMVMG